MKIGPLARTLFINRTPNRPIGWFFGNRTVALGTVEARADTRGKNAWPYLPGLTFTCTC